MPHAQAATTGRKARVEPGCREPGGRAAAVFFSSGKNVLQQILQIEHARDLKVAVGGRQPLADSVATFGITRSPASMSQQLRTLSRSTIGMRAGGMQVIYPNVTVAGDCPEPLRQLVLRVAHEFVGNAVKHGMHGSVFGAASVHLVTGIDGCTSLVVTDDVWGVVRQPGCRRGTDNSGRTVFQRGRHNQIASNPRDGGRAWVAIAEDTARPRIDGIWIRLQWTTRERFRMKSSMITAFLVGIALVLSGCVIEPRAPGWCFYHPYRCHR